MGYWDDMKIQSTFKRFVEEYNGSLQCDCDHGCRQWVKQQETKTGLMLMVAETEGITPLNKIAQMTPERATKIWRRIVKWQAQKFNRELRESRK